MNQHLPECPQSRYKDNECICDLLRTVRSAQQRPRKREDERREDRD